MKTIPTHVSMVIADAKLTSGNDCFSLFETL